MDGQPKDLIALLNHFQDQYNKGLISGAEYYKQREKIWEDPDFCDFLDPNAQIWVDTLLSVYELLDLSVAQEIDTEEMDYMHQLLNGFMRLLAWSHETLHARCAFKTYLCQSGGMAILVSMYLNHAIFPKQIRDMAGSVMWTFGETGRDRRLAHAAGVADAQLHEIIHSKDRSIVGGYWSYLEYDDCQLAAAKNGLIPLLFEFLETPLKGGWGETIESEIGCLYSISCHPEAIPEFLPHLSYITKKRAVPMESFLMSLIVANILHYSEQLTEEHISTCLDYVNYFLENVKWELKNCEGYRWITMKPFEVILHSQYKAVHLLGLLTLASHWSNKENLILISHEGLTESIMNCAFWPQYEDPFSKVIKSTDHMWRTVPTLDSMATYAVEKARRDQVEKQRKEKMA